MNLKATYLRLRFWLLDWMNGSPIRKPYKEIKYLSEHADSVGNMLRADKLNSLLDHAGAVYAAMSGSGSAVFGLFEGEPHLDLGDELFLHVEHIN